MSATIPANPRHILTPTKLNRLARTLLQSEIGMIWLSGEISNFVAAASGHWYFTLKDNKAQIRAAMFRQANHRVIKKPKEGDKVLLRASVSLYEPRGDYQLIVEHMEAEGEGALKREFELLKQQLNQEGLFSTDKKRPLPARIERIGVITSSSGAALHDVLSVLQRRAPDIEVIVYPTLVQGEQAPQAIFQALNTANRRSEVDALLVTRGGGSMEDLWAFNNAELARAIAESELVVVSAVGHEVDITISDLVADLRAPTPSAAAELLSPDYAERTQRLKNKLHRLSVSTHQQLDKLRNKYRELYSTLSLLHPAKQCQQHAQYIDSLCARLANAIQNRIQVSHTRLTHISQRLNNEHPRQLIAQANSTLSAQSQNLHQAWQIIHGNKQQQLQRFGGHLHALSPLATLGRGYTMALQDGNAVTSAQSVDMSKPMITRFHDGEVVSTPEVKQ